MFFVSRDDSGSRTSPFIDNSSENILCYINFAHYEILFCQNFKNYTSINP